jgi:1-deoxy-D-xylulose-5-phosphate synthase
VGASVGEATAAAETLSGKGISAAVVDARFVKPLDADLILPLAEKTGRVVTVEENVRQGGFGSAVLELLEEAGLLGRVAVSRVGIADLFVDHGPQRLLRAKYGVDAAAVAAAAETLVGRGR